MGIHYRDRQRATAAIGKALDAAGWKLYGWKEDRSDSMSDHYDPELWCGIGTLTGAIVCVDVAAWQAKDDSGKDEIRHGREPAETCIRCDGGGVDPSGWTLEKARAEPRAYHLARIRIEHDCPDAPLTKCGTGVRVFKNSSVHAGLVNVVSPIPFDAGGALRCVKCHGNGHKWRRTTRVAFTWPKFQANPGRCSWHVERGGTIIDKGTGVFAMFEKPDAKARLARLVKRVTAAATKAVSHA